MHVTSSVSLSETVEACVSVAPVIVGMYLNSYNVRTTYVGSVHICRVVITAEMLYWL